MTDRIQRIERMEAVYDRLRTGFDRELYAELLDYYEGGLWLEDYQADERGELPKNLKRGVLSQDGVWDLMTIYEEKCESE